MPRLPNPVTIEEAIECLFDIHSRVKHLLKLRLGPNTKEQLEHLRRALLPLLKRHDKKRLTHAARYKSTH